MLVDEGVEGRGGQAFATPGIQVLLAEQLAELADEQQRQLTALLQGGQAGASRSRSIISTSLSSPPPHIIPGIGWLTTPLKADVDNLTLLKRVPHGALDRSRDRI
ncbi:hypothetical protein [Halomonas halmophila]|uniref:Uncharacterized protein n=1 Tax=Halomonas halmophila TaxID=252 RepID=A0A4Y4F4E2_9GAMM|nr:hypothetical protein [Halomonas halmophila]GED23615.1 hypothetical protein HHA01_25920 [Halomonas halmophila]